MEGLWRDLCYGVRMFRTGWLVTLVAVLTLTLGIGANTTIFSGVKTVLLNPLPYPQPERLYVLQGRVPDKGTFEMGFSLLDFEDYRAEIRSFEGLAAFRRRDLTLTGRGQPERTAAIYATSDYFALLGIRPSPGRNFLPSETRVGGDRVVILSHGFWQRRFGGDSGAVGQVLTLNGENFTIAGVLPPLFVFPGGEDLWLPAALLEAREQDRARRGFVVLARLKAGIGLQQAQAELDAVSRRLQQEYPGSNEGLSAYPVPLHKEFIGEAAYTSGLITLAAVGFVLLIACANISNLLLARAIERRKEMAIRAALGAARLRIVRQLLTESLLLAVVGGAAGLLLASWGIHLLKPLMPADIPRVNEMQVDGSVLGFTAALTLLSSFVFGLAPALQLSKRDLHVQLRTGSPGGVAGARGHMASLLVAFEISVALVLLIGTGLLVRSVILRLRVDPGFKARDVLTARVVLPEARYSMRDRQQQFFQQLLERLQASPGVESAGIISALPLGGSDPSSTFTIEARSAETQIAGIRTVSRDYFRALGIPLLHGHELPERAETRSPVAVINETMARRFWPGRNPVGQRIKLGSLGFGGPWLEIIGVVGDVKQVALDKPTPPEVYVSYRQFPLQSAYLVVRTVADRADFADVLRAQVYNLDKDFPVFSVRNMTEVVSQSVRGHRMMAKLMGVLACSALALAAVGICGVMAHSVERRTREIAIRIALGARPADVLRLMLLQGAVPAGLGVAVGLILALGLTRLMSGVLFGVRAADFPTFAAMAVLLAAVAVAASYFPAVRATRLDPMVSLRHE